MRELGAMWRNTRMVVLCAISAALYAAVLVPFKVVPLIPGVTELRPANAIPVVCSFLFGPAAAWGAAIGNMIGDFFGGGSGHNIGVDGPQSKAAMAEGRIARVEELTRIPSDVQDALITILSEKTLPVPELGIEVQAAKGFSVIATANDRDRGVNELSSALRRRFNTVVLPLPATEDEEGPAPGSFRRHEKNQKQCDVSRENGLGAEKSDRDPTVALESEGCTQEALGRAKPAYSCPMTTVPSP